MTSGFPGQSHLRLRWLPAVLLGTITAVGGGAVRDVVLNRIPTVLGGNTLYATCAAAASGVLVVLYRNGYPDIGTVSALLFGAAFAPVIQTALDTGTKALVAAALA